MDEKTLDEQPKVVVPRLNLQHKFTDAKIQNLTERRPIKWVSNDSTNGKSTLPSSVHYDPY